jgi:sodium-dependent dicarboxylate transporter 2/3/5
MTSASVALEKNKFEWKRYLLLSIGIALFAATYYSSPWPDAIDPMGEHFPLSREAKGAIAVFLLAGTWWVFEVVPIGITSLAIGVLQALFLIRPAKVAFNDFMDPSVMFIFASIVIGLVFTKTGLTKRLAYKMLVIVGEKTSMIYLGCFVVTAALTHIMAHTAVAANNLSPFAGGLQPLRRRRQTHQIRQRTLYRHGLCGRGRQHRNPFGSGARGCGHRVF